MSILTWILFGGGAGGLARRSLRRWLWPDWRHRAGTVAALVGEFLTSTRLGIDVTGFGPSNIITIAFVGAVIPIALGLGFTGASAGASSKAPGELCPTSSVESRAESIRVRASR